MNGFDRRRFLGAAAGSAAASGWAAQQLVRADETSAAATDTSLPGRTPHTKFAVNIEMWFKKLKTYEERIHASAELGFPAVEFWPWRGKNLEAIAAAAAETKIEIAQFTAWGFVPGMNDPKFQDKFVKEIEASCEAAKTLRCKKMTVVGGNDIKGKTQEEMHAQIIKALKEAAPIAEAHDVMMILEPMNIRVDHKGHCLYGSEAAVRICREVGSSHVKINWDLYHMQISEGDLCGRLKDGFDQMGYLQLADHPGRNEPGTGEIHYNRVLRQALELGYQGYVGLECNPKSDELTAARAVAAADVW